MSRTAVTLSLVAVLSCWLTADARADFLITDNNARYALSDIPLNAFDESADTDLKPEGTVDHLYDDWWWFRESTDSREFAFNSPTSEIVSGNTATLSFVETNFSATIHYMLTDGWTPGEASLTETLTVTNTSDGTLIIDLFHYADIDANGTEDNEFATLAGINRIRVDDGGAFTVDHQGIGALNWEVGDNHAMDFEDVLQDGAVLNLTSSTLPFGPGDVNSIFQWQLVLEPGQSGSVVSGFSPQYVPEPASLMLLAPAVMLMLKRRRSAA
jgi:hypothetical protein